MLWSGLDSPELQLSLGLIDESQQTVSQALALDANQEKTQTVKGFTRYYR